MKLIMAFITLVIILTGCGESQNEANIDAVNNEPTKEMGLEWAELYEKRFSELENGNISWDYNVDVDMDVLKRHIAHSYATNKVFGDEVTQQDAKETIYEWSLLAQYAKDNDIYPTEEEIDHYIEDKIIKPFNENEIPSFLEGQLEGLRLTLEEHLKEFERYQKEAIVVHMNVSEHIGAHGHEEMQELIGELKGQKG